MDWCLGFKSQAHSQFFHSNFTLQLCRRFVVVTLLFIMNSMWIGLDYGINFENKNKTITAWCFVRGIGCLLWMSYVYWLKKRCERCDQFIKRAKLTLFILDLLALVFTVDILPYTCLAEHALLISGWGMGVYFLCSVMIIGYWHVRIFACFLQIAIYFVMVLAKDDVPNFFLVRLVQLFIIFGLLTYFNEKFTRDEFLKRVKCHEDSQAIKKVLDDVMEGIMIIDGQKQILYLNETAEKMFQNKTPDIDRVFCDIKVKQVLGCTKHEQSSEGTSVANVFDDVVNHFFNPKKDAQCVVQFITIEGYKNHIESEGLKSYQIKFAGSVYNDKRVIVANISDTTEREAYRLLQDDNNYKTRLFASVSHELRTPLNGSINFAEQALSDPEVPQSAKKNYVLPALRSSRMLLCLINDFLDFSQMQANKLRLSFERKSIVETAKECLELLEIQAAKRGIELKLESSLSKHKEELVSDHNRLKQIILNFLSNAVKFTFEGGVYLKIEEVLISGFRGVRIKCEDSGIGISEESQTKLFQAFEKIELGKESRINATGVGLGLVISNNLAELLNQGLENQNTRPIKFVSTLGKGTTFWVDIVDREHLEARIPLAIEELSIELDMMEKNRDDPNLELKISPVKSKSSIDRKATSQDDVSSAGGGLIITERMPFSIPSTNLPNCTCPKVLIVDDDSFNLTALDQNLKKLRITCDWAFNGLQALQKIQRRQEQDACGAVCEQYKIVFLDCNMPVLDGFETAKALRKLISEKKINSDIKIVACTACVHASELDQAIAAGMDDVCTKPISLNIIKEKLFKFELL